MLSTVALIASATSALVYWQLIVPQLPGMHSVPLWWWALMLLPVGLVVVWAGHRSRSFSEVLASAPAIVLPWVLVEVVYSLITGRPVAHDVWATDPSYWFGVVLYLVICGVGVGLTAVMFGWVRHYATASNKRVNPPAGSGPR